MVSCGVQSTALSQGLGRCGSSSPCAGLAEWGLHCKAYPSHLDHPAEIDRGASWVLPIESFCLHRRSDTPTLLCLSPFAPREEPKPRWQSPSGAG